AGARWGRRPRRRLGAPPAVDADLSRALGRLVRLVDAQRRAAEGDRLVLAAAPLRAADPRPLPAAAAGGPARRGGAGDPRGPHHCVADAPNSIELPPGGARLP